MSRWHWLPLLLGLAACARQEVPPAAFDTKQFSGTKALFEVQGLVAQGPRDAGTPGAYRAALYLKKRLEANGVTAVVDTFTNRTVRGPTLFHNVIGRIPGSSSNLILVSSHYDTKVGIPGFQGANDSGSSSGALIELGRILANRERRGPEIQLVFFDGEECVDGYSEIDGFHGSRHYAQHLVDTGRHKQVLAVINLDMIGDTNLTVTLARNNDSKLATMFLKAASDENVRRHFELYPHEIGDDHVQFLERGMPAVDIIDFDFGSSPGLNDYWHTPQDTMDKLSADSLQIIGRVTLRVLNDLIAEDHARSLRKR